MGIGDAYGACFESCDRKHVERNNDLRYDIHPRNLKKHPEDVMPSLVPRGHYTDDTQMTIGNIEMMLERPRFFERTPYPWESDGDVTESDIVSFRRIHWRKVKEIFADKYLEVFKRNERRGYTMYLLHTLMNSVSGKDLLSKLNGKSDKSGAFMRAPPFGFYEDVNDVIISADMQARVTHDSWVGRHSSVGAALMTHYFYHKLGPKEDLVTWMKDLPSWVENDWPYHGREICNFSNLHSDEAFEVQAVRFNQDGQEKIVEDMVQPWKPGRRVRVHGWDCLESAIYAIERNDNMADILKDCVSHTGDVDTNTAVAAAAASCSEEIEQNIPSILVQNLENGSFGRDFLDNLDKQFQEAFPCKS